MSKTYDERCQELMLSTLQKLEEAPMDRKPVHKIEVWFEGVEASISYAYLPRISITFKE